MTLHQEPLKAAFGRHFTVNTGPFAATLETIDLTGLTIVEFGVGGGNVTELILKQNLARVIGYERDSAALKESVRKDPRFALREMDFTQEDYSYLSGEKFAVISNPPYDLLPFIRKNVIEPYAPEGVVLLSSRKKTAFFPDYEILSIQPGEDFDPPALGQHFLIVSGFEGRRGGRPDIPVCYAVKAGTRVGPSPPPAPEGSGAPGLPSP